QQADLAHPPVVFEVDAAALMKVAMPAPAEVSRQPVVLRDLALWVDEAVSLQAMLDTIDTVRAEPGMDIVRDVSLFDVYRDKSLSEKETSLAFRFRLQDTQVTLDDARVDECMAQLRNALIARHGARQRV